MRDALPPPLPPETRTVGQLIAESIRFYQEHFWACLPLGLVIAVLSQDATLAIPLQVVALAASSPFMAATYVRAISLVTGAAWSCGSASVPRSPAAWRSAASTSCTPGAASPR
jgi:hypothetical protein